MLTSSLGFACIVATAAGVALTYRRHHVRRRAQLYAEQTYRRIQQDAHTDTSRSAD